MIELFRGSQQRLRTQRNFEEIDAQRPSYFTDSMSVYRLSRTPLGNQDPRQDSSLVIPPIQLLIPKTPRRCH